VNDKSAMQATILDDIKKKLPILIDQATLLTEISMKDNALIYHLDVKGIPVSVMNTLLAGKYKEGDTGSIL